MKNAKFVIMLQVCFLIGIFVFSASAVYQPEQITPCAITNLALRQDGLELASPKEHEAYLFSYDALDNFKEMADALKSGEAIENRENVKAIHGVGTDNPVYLISFTCTQEGSKNGKQFYYIIAPKDPQLPEITNLVNEDSKEISEALGVFIAPSLTKPLTDVVEAAKTSSAGRDLVSPWLHIDKDELEASITRLKSASQMPFEEESNDLAIKRNINRDTIILTAMHEIEEIGFDAAYTVAPDKLTVLLTKLLADKSLLIQQQAAFAIVETKGPIAYRALGTLIELLKDDSASVIERKKAEEAILDIGYSALPLLDKELVLFDKQLELVLLDKELEGDYPELTEIIQGIKASVKEIPRTSSSGIVDDKEAIKSLFNALQSQGLTNKERTSIIESLRTRITDLFSYVGYTEQSMKNNAIDAIVEIRAVITSALNTIEETLVGKEYAGTMIDLVNNIESFRGRPFEVQPKDISPELYRELFGSLAIQGRNINSKAINNINLEAAEQNFEELQAQLKEAKSKEDNGIQVPVDVMTALIRSVNAAELNLLALQREKYILDMREDAARTSSGGIDKATEIKEQIEVAQVYMDNLTSKLEKAMVERDIANQKGTANDFALADIEVEKLKESIALNQKDIDDRVDVIAGILNEQNEIKASSGGLLPSHQQILDSLKSDQANLTTLAGLQTNISQTASEYRQLSVSSTSAESEQAYNLQYLGDTGAIIESTLFANEIFQNKEPFYILFDKNQFPENQFAIAERVREIERLKESMNCIVIRGDIVNIDENKVKEDKTSLGRYTGLTDWGTNTFNVPEEEIDRMYVPIRKLWDEYNSEPYKAKVFAMAGQEEALTSDDPLRLSNNKVWWEEGAWLDRYDQSQSFQRRGESAPEGYTGSREPLKKGQWVRNLSFMARDSDDDFLTFLRGASFKADFNNGASVDMVAATPRSLWDTYEEATNVPAAIRVKTPISDKLTIGGLYTFKGGMRHQSLEAMNNLGALDGSYQLFNNTNLFGEFAASNMNTEEASGYENHYTGYAGSFGLKNQGPIALTDNEADKYEFKASFASMSDTFFPGLSNYRFTRKESEFAKHIYFEDLDPRNEAIMFGDGMDIGRNALNISTKIEFPDNNIDGQFDFRTVYSDGNEHIEDVYRLEGTYQPVEKLTLKGLVFYKHLPKTKQGIDPLMNAKSSYSAFTDYFAYEDVWLENSAVQEGKDPSIGAFSGGLQYDFTDYFSGYGVFETTNDPKDYPRGLLNNVWVGDYFKDNIVWDRVVPFLNDQSAFGTPDYPYYNIYKTRFTYQPFDPLKITLKYTYNENKYAMAIDDNPTAQGVEFEYKPCPNTTLGFLYQYTRQRDMYKEFVLEQGTHFDGHHNIFAAFDYQLNQDQHLRIMYGNYVGYDYNTPENHDDLNALDTRHIVRVAYTGTFGPVERQDEDQYIADATPTPLGPLNPAIPGATFIAKLSTGWAKYKEEAVIAPVESDWDNYLLRCDLGMDAYDREYWEGSLRLGLFTTLTDEEKWDYEGKGTYQTDDMSFRGADVNANIGWAITSESKYLSVAPLVNIGYRRVEFSRGKISTTSTTVPQLGENDENFNVSYAGLGARVELGPVNNMSFYGSGYWAPLVYAPINNSELGRTTCDQGTIWHAEGGCDYSLSEKFDVNLGGFWDLQHLERADRIDNGRVNIETPENKLETFGLTLGGQYRF